MKYIRIPHEEFVPTCAAPENLAGDSWNLLGDEVFRCENTKKIPEDSFQEDLDTLLQDKSNKMNLKSFSSKHTVPDQNGYEHIVDAMASLSEVHSKSAVVKWILDDPDGMCKKLFVQYYQVGSKDSTQLIAPVSSTQDSYIMRHLEPETLYKACVLPATSTSEVPSSVLSPTQCVQFETAHDNDSPEHSFASDINFRLPTSEEITVYSKLLGFCFVVSVIITGACMFILEVVGYCYRLLCCKHVPNQKVSMTKIHKD